MIDPILSARLEALKDNLTRVKDLELPGRTSSCWLTLESQQFEPGTAMFVRERLGKAMRDQAEKKLTTIADINTHLQNAETRCAPEQRKVLLEAWYAYTEVQKECREFFGDCLAFMGGLNFRSMNVADIEERIYRLADALVRECATRAITGVDQWSPTVPYLPETLIRTAARVTGLRFQEWTIWMLPFTTHELGHVLFREVEYLREFVDRRTASIKDPGKKVRLEKQLHEFLADAFATYNLGPAYPCALLILGLNPVSVDDKSADGSAPAKRAYAVLKILEHMDVQPGLATPYADIRQKLTDSWDCLLAGLDPQVTRLSKNEQAATDALVGEIWTHLATKFTKSTAKYPHDPASQDRGWQTANRWHNAWCDQLPTKERPLGILPDEIGPRNLLADVLNAAWSCRLDHPNDADTESIAEAAYNLAKQLLSKRA